MQEKDYMIYRFNFLGWMRIFIQKILYALVKRSMYSCKYIKDGMCCFVPTMCLSVYFSLGNVFQCLFFNYSIFQ
jgi:hypothetical protein